MLPLDRALQSMLWLKLQGRSPRMPADTEPHRKLAAILSADAVGYSRLMQTNERAALEMLKSCRAAIL